MKTNIHKRARVATMLLLTNMLIVNAQDKLYTSNVTVTPGANKVIEVMLESSGEYCGFQTDISLPKGISITENDFAVSGWPEHTYEVIANQLSDTQWRLLAYSRNTQPLSGSEDALFRMNVNVGADFAGGTLTLNNTRFATTASTETMLTQSNATIDIVDFSHDKLCVNDVTVTPGESKTIEVTLENKGVYCGFQTDITLPEGVTATESDFTLSDRQDGTYKMIANKLSNTQWRLLTYSTDTQALSGNDGTLFTINVDVDKNFSGGTLTLSNTRFATAAPAEATLAQSDAAFNISESYIVGDANGDGRISATDITTIADYIVSGNESLINKAAADANKDGRVSATDITTIASMILN